LVASSSHASWIEDESSTTIVHGNQFEPKLCFVYSLKKIVPFLCVV